MDVAASWHISVAVAVYVCVCILTHKQVEAHPYWSNSRLLAFCKANSIHMTAYSPLGSPDSASVCVCV